MDELFAAISKFMSDIEHDDNFLESYKIVKKNSEGKVWLTGSAVYGQIAANHYGNTVSAHDYDLVVEKKVEKISLPWFWRIAENRHGNPKFINGEKHIDYIPLNTIHSIVSRNIRNPIIDDYIRGTPLTVQSIVYDIEDKAIIGDVGLEAISKKEVAVNYMDEAIYAAYKKEMDLEDYIKKIADSLGFKVVF